jgi:hypothetical protein
LGSTIARIRPTEFNANSLAPEVQADNGTIYGQAFPTKAANDRALIGELHYYHLWRKDCGGNGHPLDTEHVAVLIQASDTPIGSAKWKAAGARPSRRKKPVASHLLVTVLTGTDLLGLAKAIHEKADARAGVPIMSARGS